METKGNILVVDDTEETLYVLADILQDESYTVYSALNGELALVELEKHTPDLILLDIRMPEMDGLELCRRIKAQKKYEQIQKNTFKTKRRSFNGKTRLWN